jgi:hypothetical protein
MADHQHVEMLVDGVHRVGARRVGGGRAARWPAPQTLMMSGAWPPPAPSVWKAWMVRPLMAAMVFDEAGLVQRVGVDHHLHVVWSATDRQQSMAPGVVPQSSCSFSAQAPRASAPSAAGSWRCPCRGRPGSSGKASAAWSMRRYARGRACRWWRACRGRAGAAAEHGGQAGHQRLLDLLRADEVDVRIEAAGGEDLALAGDGLGAGADDDVDAGLGVRVAGLADGGDAPVLEADIGLVRCPSDRRSARW